MGAAPLALRAPESERAAGLSSVAGPGSLFPQERHFFSSASITRMADTMTGLSLHGLGACRVSCGKKAGGEGRVKDGQVAPKGSYFWLSANGVGGGPLLRQVLLGVIISSVFI